MEFVGIIGIHTEASLRLHERTGGSVGEAVACSERALATWEEGDFKFYVAKTLDILGDLHAATGDEDRAQSHYRRPSTCSTCSDPARPLRSAPRSSEPRQIGASTTPATGDSVGSTTAPHDLVSHRTVAGKPGGQMSLRMRTALIALFAAIFAAVAVSGASATASAQPPSTQQAAIQADEQFEPQTYDDCVIYLSRAGYFGYFVARGCTIGETYYLGCLVVLVLDGGVPQYHAEIACYLAAR
ncbi:tetratricopeptide repeat protein [Glycomyces harbinensis]|uniref:tetratricopeptide repeat protein n=1 Tax=Glycomyces harbinensis TaxID=58114 RepID=UPI00115FDA22|nr:tetratricopeptide repeat protein [Glycomyces harbinensis]